MKSVEDLDVFKLALQLALKTYSTTKTFPRAETFSLVDQMRRAASVYRNQKTARALMSRLADEKSCIANTCRPVGHLHCGNRVNLTRANLSAKMMR